MRGVFHYAVKFQAHPVRQLRHLDYPVLAHKYSERASIVCHAIPHTPILNCCFAWRNSWTIASRKKVLRRTINRSKRVIKVHFSFSSFAFMKVRMKVNLLIVLGWLQPTATINRQRCFRVLLHWLRQLLTKIKSLLTRIVFQPPHTVLLPFDWLKNVCRCRTKRLYNQL